MAKKGERSNKAWVRKHHDSYWTVIGRKITAKKDKDEPKDKKRSPPSGLGGSDGPASPAPSYDR
jgi:hypothetical protein